MLLALDIGNTNTVAGMFDGEDLVAQWRLTTDARRTPDEYTVLLSTLFALRRLDPGLVHGVIIASVVPGAQAAVGEAITRYLAVPPVILSASLDLGIEVRYDPPTAIGADRLANAVAAVRKYGPPAVVVDFGTGTNFDVIAADGAYVGGAIAPGLEIATDALFARAAKLPQVALTAPPTAIGTSTSTALQSGIVFGYAGLVDGLVTRIAAELDCRPHVIATGGLAPVVAPHAATIRHVDLDLTLHGLRLVYDRSVSPVRR